MVNPMSSLLHHPIEIPQARRPRAPRRGAEMIRWWHKKPWETMENVAFTREETMKNWDLDGFSMVSSLKAGKNWEFWLRLKDCIYQTLVKSPAFLKVICSFPNRTSTRGNLWHHVCRKPQQVQGRHLRNWSHIPFSIYWFSGWWCGTFFIFPYVGNFIIPTDELHHFSEG